MRFELENTPRNAQAPVFLEIDYVDMCLGGSDFFKVGAERIEISVTKLAHIHIVDLNQR